MQKKLRQQFNDNFTEEKYKNYLHELDALHPGEIDFRIAETPIFIPRDFTNKMLSTCEDIIDIILQPDFLSLTDNAIPAKATVPGRNTHSHFIAFDFGVCINKDGEIEPQLIEMQGFPTLFGFQTFQTAITAKYANIPESHDAYLNGYTKETYIQLLKEIIVGDENPENVILLDIFPDQQKTRIDFYCTEDILGIKTVCLTKIISKENKLFYIDNRKEIEIKRIYNRLIFDDLGQQNIPENTIDLKHPWDVIWITHPKWFYRISKFILPLIHNKYVPKTFYLNEVKQIPDDLENYVLKPLFSFAGMGVIIDVTKEDIEKITDPENWILQQKVKYADIIETPNSPAKAEIRLFYFRKNEWERPVAVHNLVRLSKGKMIGTRYNQNKTWVGGNVAFFEK